MVKQKEKTRRINENYIKRYDRVVLTQPLAHNTVLQQIYDKTDRGWKLHYSSNSIHHVCPYDGVFRKCSDCGALNDDFDIKFCTNKQQTISIGALNGRIQDCLKANLQVDFINGEE